jgi:hypothetical protein
MRINKNYWLAASGAPAEEKTGVAGCSECDRLWKESYGDLEEYLRILTERNAARKRQDHDLVEAFEPIESESLAKCQNAQRAILDHAVTHLLEKISEGVESTELLPQ